MWFLSNSSAKDRPTVVQTVPAEVAETLRTSGPTDQALIDLAALSFQGTDAMRIFVLEVASHLTSPETFHQVTDYLTRARLDENTNNVKNLLTVEALARTFLAYQFVHHKDWAVTHIQEDGAIYSALGWGQLAVLVTGTMSMPASMPEVAYFLFKKEGYDYSQLSYEAATLKTDRVRGGVDDKYIKYLNRMDQFIIKYFMAELDETRKNQEDRRMDDERGGYRGGRKLSVGLAIRDALVTKGIDGVPAAFQAAISANNISYAEFFESGSDPDGVRKYLGEELLGILKAAVPSSSAAPR